MRQLFVLAMLLSACSPAGYYVANVFYANGVLVQEKCEISGYNRRPDPEACHTELVAPASPQQPYAPTTSRQAPPAQQPQQY